MTPRFSIIIPHYNIPNLLIRCLDSIPISSDLQVIVVDDDSPEGDTYQEYYSQLSRPYLTFIRSPKRGGAGYARNLGLNFAKGEWLLFADADDFFADDMHDIILSNADTNVDIVYFRKKGVLSEDINRESPNKGHVNEILETYIQTGDEWPIRARHYVPWGKMIKRELVIKNHIRFDEVEYANDCFFSVLAGYYAHSIAAEDVILYYKTDRPGSLSADLCTKPGELAIRADVYFRIDRFLLEHGACRERSLTSYLIRMIKSNRPLYRYYLNNKLDEVYSSRIFAVKDICKEKRWLVRIFVYLYSFIIWRNH